LLLPLKINNFKSKRQCAAEALAYKKCDRKKQQKGRRAEGQKRPSKSCTTSVCLCAGDGKGRGFFALWVCASFIFFLL